MDGKNFFDQAVKNDLTTYDNIKKLSIGQGDDYTTGCLLYYPYFKQYYKLIAIDLGKQQKIDACPKVIKQNNFTGNVHQGGNTQLFFIMEEAKETVLDFSKGTVKLLWFYFVLI